MIAPDISTDLKITVLNPMGYPPEITRKSAAERPESLDGKTIYLVDCRFDDSIELLKQVEIWFGEHMTSVSTKIDLALRVLRSRRSEDVGRDQGERRCRDRRRRPLQHVRAGRRDARDHDRLEIRRADSRAAYREVR